MKVVAGVAAGNYLLPRKPAVPATKGNLKILEQQHEQIVHKQEQRRAEAGELAERLAGLALHFDVRVGAQGRLFGSVTAHDIAERLRSGNGIVWTDVSQACRPGVHSLYALLATVTRPNRRCQAPAS